MMKIKTERLAIKSISLADQDAVLDLLTNEIVAKTYMLPEYKSREEALPLFHRLVTLSEDDTHYVAGIYLDGRFIGMMNETEVKDTQIEMGYAFLPDYYNRGYATESFKGAIGYLFEHGFETVLAGAFSENAASIRVMEKCGMVRQPQTDQIEYRGMIYSCVYYAIQKEHEARAALACEI